jgi:hypothetical protein
MKRRVLGKTTPFHPLLKEKPKHCCFERHCCYPIFNPMFDKKNLKNQK